LLPVRAGAPRSLHRLQTRAQFQAVLAGAIVARTPHFALHHRPPAQGVKEAVVAARQVECAANGGIPDMTRSTSTKPHPAEVPTAEFVPNELWLGVMVPKRWAKRAVTRNLIKRQTYTVSAQFAENFPPGAFVVRLRSEFSRRDFVSAASEALKQAVRDEVQALFYASVARS
jgi:ribonuclease P protein component